MKAFLDEIDELVGSALTASDPDERIKYIGEALKKVCLFLTKLNRKAEIFIEETLAISSIGTKGIALRLRDYVSQHEEFAVFQSAEQLREFLLVARGVLIQQGYSNSKRINEIITETRAVHEQMLDEAVSLEDFAEKFRMLGRFFCRPPEGPLGGGSKPTGGGGGGASETRSQAVCRYIQTVAALLQLVQALAIGSPTMPPPSHSPPSSSPPITLPLRLFTLIRLAAFTSFLNGQEHIPTVEEYEQESIVQTA